MTLNQNFKQICLIIIVKLAEVIYLPKKKIKKKKKTQKKTDNILKYRAPNTS